MLTDSQILIFLNFPILPNFYSVKYLFLKSLICYNEVNIFPQETSNHEW